MTTEIFTVLGILSAILVVTSTSTVYSVLWLVSTFIIVSIILGLLNLGFPALLYIIVYVGAIAILFLFVVQLLDLGNEDTVVSNNSSRNDGYNTLTLAVIFAVSLSVLIVLSVSQNNLSLDNIIYDNLDILGYSRETGLAKEPLVNILTFNKNIFPLLISENGNTPQVSSLAEWLYGPGLLPLIVVSIILLVSMVAPISLCKD